MAELHQLPGTTTSAPAGAPVKPPAVFFELESKYLINPSATARQLFEDANILLEVGLDILEEVGLEVEQARPRYYGAIYLLRQAHAALSEAIRRAPNT